MSKSSAVTPAGSSHSKLCRSLANAISTPAVPNAMARHPRRPAPKEFDVSLATAMPPYLLPYAISASFPTSVVKLKHVPLHALNWIGGPYKWWLACSRPSTSFEQRLLCAVQSCLRDSHSEQPLYVWLEDMTAWRSTKVGARQKACYLAFQVLHQYNQGYLILFRSSATIFMSTHILQFCISSITLKFFPTKVSIILFRI
ncbi:uncharacterized protein LOC122004860 [Zingiber officinale]|uniref:uncharacterized protein LOC122004860 n=1 Tax=Zingiber officinale TaxID=94328 RepID=UPI001C4B4BC6|nr:uncharacterized protein LOC122004860 [Zingiber officinale]